MQECARVLIGAAFYHAVFFSFKNKKYTNYLPDSRAIIIVCAVYPEVMKGHTLHRSEILSSFSNILCNHLWNL